MGFKEAVLTCFRKYATFSGRARRSEYWYFSLFNMIVSSVLGLILGETIIPTLVALALVIPGIAVAIRRMHDIGKSGAWLFIGLTIVGLIPLLIWYCRDSAPGANSYGPNPKSLSGKTV